MKAMEFLAIMWHYIVPPEGVWVNGIRVAGEQCGIERFRRQLETLKKDFNIISFSDLLIGKISKKSVLLTFDDGLQNQYDLAFPILQKMELPAMFSVMTHPLEGIIPATFKLQLIGGEGSGVDLQYLRENIFPEILKKKGLEGHLEKIKIPEGLYRIEPQPLKEIKFICNMRLSAQEKIAVVDEMFYAIFPDRESEFCRQMFMSAHNIRDLSRNGMEIASHGIGHHLISSLSLNELCVELEESREILNGLISTPAYTFVYPSAFSGDEQIETLVYQAGYRLGLAYDGKPVLNSLPISPFCIRRIHEADLEKFVSF